MVIIYTSLIPVDLFFNSTEAGPTDERNGLGFPQRYPGRHPRLAQELPSQALKHFKEVQEFESYLLYPVCMPHRGVQLLNKHWKKGNFGTSSLNMHKYWFCKSVGTLTWMLSWTSFRFQRPVNSFVLIGRKFGCSPPILSLPIGNCSGNSALH